MYLIISKIIDFSILSQFPHTFSLKSRPNNIVVHQLELKQYLPIAFEIKLQLVKMMQLSITWSLHPLPKSAVYFSFSTQSFEESMTS